MDYGTNNNSIISNLTIETNRAFTGHEQIAELSGLIHMNARVYDSDIGRFLSADTMIQYPNHSQGYNRYAYVRNNPMMFTDPSGHSWFSKKWKKFKKWAKRKWRKIVGGILVVVGVVAGFTPFAWASKPLIATGASLIAYDPSRPESRSNQVTVSVGTTVPINFGGGSGKNPAEQEEQIDDLRAEEAARAKTYTGIQNNLGSSSDNGKYANGAGTGSYENTGASISVSGITVLTLTAPSNPRPNSLWAGTLQVNGSPSFLPEEPGLYDMSEIFIPVGRGIDILYTGVASRFPAALMGNSYVGVGSKLFGNQSSNKLKISGTLNNKDMYRRLGWSGYYNRAQDIGYSTFRYSKGHGKDTQYRDFFMVPNDIGNKIIKDMQNR